MPEDISDLLRPRNTDQLNADDLIATGPVTVTITGWKRLSGEQPFELHITGFKPYRPCLTCMRVMAALWGKDSDAWIGKRLTLCRDPKVTFGRDVTGGIRISHMSDIPEKGADLSVTTIRSRKGAYHVDFLPSTEKRTQPKPVQSEAQRLREALIVAEPDKSKRVAQFAEWGIVDPRKDDEFTPEKLEMMWKWIEERNGSKFA